MSRRVIIEDSDDDDNDGMLGQYAPFLKPSGQSYVLDKNRQDDFINLIPTSRAGITEYQMHAITSALRACEKKIRIKLFRQNKAEIIFGSWWDYSLTKLGDDVNNENVKNLLLEMMNFSTVLQDTIKNKTDLKKAKDRMRVDLVKQLEATKTVISNLNGLDEIKAQLVSVEDHFRKVYQVEIGASSPSEPANSAVAPSQSAAATTQSGGTSNGLDNAASQDKPKAAATSTSGTTTTSEDRKAAAAQKRLESMKKTQMRRVGVVASSPAKPSPVKPSANDGGWGTHAPAPAANNSSAANDGGGWGTRAPAPASSRSNSASANGGGLIKQASASAPPRSTNSSSSNDVGWGRHNSAPPAPSNNSASTNNDGGWGRHAAPAPAPVSNFEPMFPGDDGSPDGWGRRPNSNPEQSTETKTSKVPEKDKPYRMWGPANRKIAPYPESSSSSRNDSQTNQSRYTAREPETNRSYQGSSQGLNESRNNVAHDDKPNHQQSNYGSTDRASNGYSSMAGSVSQSTRQPSNYGSYESSRNDAHDSRSDRQPYSGSNDRVSSTYDSQSNRQFPGSSVTEPYSHGGNIRNNQPVGGTGSTMGGSTGYHSNNNDPQQRDQYVSRRDDTGYSRGNENPRPPIQFTPREDIDPSRRASYDYNKRDSGASSYHSRSNERANDHRDYEDRRRDERPSSNSRRYDDDRRESSRGSGGSSRRRCNYFFSEKGCRNGASCRFSHEDDDGDKPPSDRFNERGRRRNFEDGGSEDGELRPAKRFRGPDNGNPQPSVINVSTAPLSAAETGRGRGRGAHLNKPAWMTQTENAQSGPTSAGAAAGATLQLNNSDLLNVLSSVNTPAPSVSTAGGVGRGRGRGTDNRPAWMTQAESTGTTANHATATETMNGRFAPPPSVQRNNPPPEQAAGRGRGRGTDNRPAWMTRAEK